MYSLCDIFSLKNSPKNCQFTTCVLLVIQQNENETNAEGCIFKIVRQLSSPGGKDINKTYAHCFIKKEEQSVKRMGWLGGNKLRGFKLHRISLKYNNQIPHTLRHAGGFRGQHAGKLFKSSVMCQYQGTKVCFRLKKLGGRSFYHH